MLVNKGCRDWDAGSKEWKSELAAVGYGIVTHEGVTKAPNVSKLQPQEGADPGGVRLPWNSSAGWGIGEGGRLLS